jgi:hypothetical protein
MLGTTLLAAAIASAQIKVTVNEDPVGFNGMQPVSINGRVFVPLRGVFERMGAFVEWNPGTQSVTATRQNSTVKLQVGSNNAWVDGSTVMMDAPARLMSGRTMVPLRFLSEALGASVNWYAATQTVAINTGAIIQSERFNPPITTRTAIMIQDGTVIPVTLDEEISSNTARQGDRFTATVRSNDDYMGLPIGTKIEGRVVAAKAKEGRNPGMLELDFRRVMLPDGRVTQMDGSLIGLDDKSVIRDSNGIYTARAEKKDERIVYAGYGAGAGLLVGLLTKKPLEGALLGGVLGFLFGEVQRNQERAADVRLRRGTEFGVRLDKDLSLRTG